MSAAPSRRKLSWIALASALIAACGSSSNSGNAGTGGTSGNGPHSNGTGGSLIGTGGGPSGGAAGQSASPAGTGGGRVGVGGGNSSGGSAGATAGAAGNGGAGAAANHCGARPGLVFCDSFEADAPGAPPAPWTVTQTTAGQVAIDGTNPAASGTRSVHVAPTDNDYDTFLDLRDTAVLPVAGGKLYVRFYIRLAAGMTAKHNTLVRGDLFASPGTGNNLLFGEDNQMILESISGDAQAAMSNQSFYTDGKIGAGAPAGVWTCIELLLDHAAPAIDVWVNDVEVPDLHRTDWKIDAYDYLRFGFEKYAGPASDIWYDDVALGTQKIGCN
ncbi:MAG TPA: hypothetical protein VHO67_13265 [Polyangia bacterium]|nr:hypothetical protein [Polyangia bacterium]